jgi:hypothetical protein
MKKIIGILLAGALVTSAFAVDFNAKVKMSGDILGGTIDLNGDKVDDNSINALKINNGIVDNNDFITTTFTGDKAGAEFKITLKDDAKLKYDKDAKEADKVFTEDPQNKGRVLVIDSAKVWIQPIDMLKITFGQQAWEQMAETTYTYGRKSAWGNSWFSDGPGDAGFDVSLTPMGGLEFNVGFKPGWDASWLSGDKDVRNVAKTNIGVKVDLNNFAGIPVTVVANWLNAVKKDAEDDMWANEFTIGASYGNAYADGLYAHLVARIGFRDFTANSKNTWKINGLLGDWDNSDKNSMIIDNAVKYSAGAFHAWLSVPVLIDLYKDNDGKDGKNCNTGLGFVVKADYSLGSVTPFVKLSQVNLGDAGKSDGRFVDFKFKPDVEVGVGFNVGSCSMGISAKAKIPGEKENLSWSIPFSATVAF